MASWPTTLPAPLASGYALNPQDQVLRTDMDAGAPRARRRTTARNDRLSVAWTFTDAQLAAFRTWFEDAAEAAGGAAWFTITLNIGTGSTASVEARFVGAWQAQFNAGRIWRVTAELEVR